MAEKAQKSEQRIYELSLEELSFLLEEYQTTDIEELFFQIDKRDHNDFVIE